MYASLRYNKMRTTPVLARLRYLLAEPSCELTRVIVDES